MKPCILIPVRPFEEGKRRLAPLLSAVERRALNARFFRHVLGVAAGVVPAGDCIVVGRSPEALALARRAGAQALCESLPGGLNAALEQAAAYALAQGAEAVLSLACDLPLLRADDLHALIARAVPGKVVIATDRAGEGTNALLVAPPCAIAYRYGPGSRDAHESAALAAGLAVETLRRAGLASDVDTPEDLDSLAFSLRRSLPESGPVARRSRYRTPGP